MKDGQEKDRKTQTYQGGIRKMSTRKTQSSGHRPKVISFVNFKGGVGKTTVAVNVAATMASADVGKKVLLIDTDAQANATIWCCGQRTWKEKLHDKTVNTVYQLFKDADSRYRNFDFNQSISATGDALLGGHAPGLRLLSSTYKMMDAEDLLWNVGPHDKTTILKNRLINEISGYDVVIIDCPPNTYCVTQNAIRMSDSIFVVAIPDFLSLIGFNELVERLLKLQNKIKIKGPVPVRGVVVSSYNPKLNEHKTGIEQLRVVVDKLAGKQWIDPRCKLYDPPISRSIACSNAARRGLPVGNTGTPGGFKLQLEFSDLSRALMRDLGI